MSTPHEVANEPESELTARAREILVGLNASKSKADENVLVWLRAIYRNAVDGADATVGNRYGEWGRVRSQAIMRVRRRLAALELTTGVWSGRGLTDLGREVARILASEVSR